MEAGIKAILKFGVTLRCKNWTCCCATLQSHLRE